MSQPLSAVEALKRAVDAQRVQQDAIRQEAQAIAQERERDRPQGNGTSP